MSQVLIPCPKCGKELRLRDRTNIGKKGRCPSCQHTFVLNEPDEVQLELADASVPAVGTSARWVPDSSAVAAPASSRPSAPVFSAPSPASPFAGIAPDDVHVPTRPPRRRGKGGKIGIIIGGVLGVVIAGVGYAVYSSAPPDEKPAAENRLKPEPTFKEEKEEAASAIELAKTSSPTPGEPIELLMVPGGASVVINLKVAELWKQDARREEFRACFGEDLGKWIEGKLKDLCLFDIPEIDSVLICLFYRAPGETPEVSGVVTLKQEVKRSVFVTKFGGEPDNTLGYPMYKTSAMAYAIGQDNPKVFAFCPAAMAGEMVGAIKSPMPTVPGIEELLEHTDRDRHITIVFRPDDARVHQKTLVPELMLPFWNQMLDWFNPDEVESVAWSLHVTDKRFFSDLKLRNKPVVPPVRLSRDLRKKLDHLGVDLVSAVEKMEPKEAGSRQLIGRFPAMMQVFGMETSIGAAERYVQLNTILPERAAPNIVLGAVLAWDESTRTDFSKTKAPPTTPTTPSGTANETIVAKLQKKIEIDFRKTPLQEAIAYIGENTGIATDIDGDGLKFAGYTKNMAQDMKLGVVPATEALKEILKKYTKRPNEKDDMCLIVDEEKKLLTLTTKAGADKMGKKPYDLK